MTEFLINKFDKRLYLFFAAKLGSFRKKWVVSEKLIL